MTSSTSLFHFFFFFWSTRSSIEWIYSSCIWLSRYASHYILSMFMLCAIDVFPTKSTSKRREHG